MIKTLFYIALGSGLGGVLRYAVTKLLQQSAVEPFPLGTFVVNVAGCFLIGLCYGLVERGNLMNNELRLFLTVGLCGGFTTFSTLVNENYSLLQGGNVLVSALYLGASVALGLLAVYGGNSLVKII